MIAGTMSDKMLGPVERRRECNSLLYAISDPMVSKLCALVCHSEGERATVSSRSCMGKRLEEANDEDQTVRDSGFVAVLLPRLF
jgi:hypothetical protein